MSKAQDLLKCFTALMGIFDPKIRFVFVTAAPGERAVMLSNMPPATLDLVLDEAKKMIREKSDVHDQPVKN